MTDQNAGLGNSKYMLACLEPTSVGLKSCSTPLSLTDLGEINTYVAQTE